MRLNHSIIALVFLVTLSACALFDNPDDSLTTTLTPATVTPETSDSEVLSVTPELPSTPVIATSITITESTPSLTIWIPPNTVLGTEAGTAEFSDQLLAFNGNYPELETHVEQKPLLGQGGILNYLRTGANVAPAILPDLIALPSNQLAAASDGLIYPLNEIIDPTLFDDLFPAARSLATVNEQFWGYPFTINNLTHLVYQTNVITTTPPLLWNEFIAIDNGNLIFPAAGSAGAQLALQFYLAGEGTLVNEAGQAALDPQILTMALQQLNQGRSNGFILLQSSNVDTHEESWETFQAGTAAFSLTTIDQYLDKRTPETSPGYSVIPGLSTPLSPIVDGWVWAISAADPSRRALAGELLTFLVSGPNLGEWSLQSNRIPANRSAFSAWPTDDAYLNFVQLELERAQPNPVSPEGQLMTAISNAVFNVISLAKSPQEAAGEAVSDFQP